MHVCTELNPLRYRGYVYDTETELYYLQSRYYNPELCRFISPDTFASTGQGFVGNNMFAYCNNNPVLFKDSTGTRPILSTSLRNETEDDKKASFAYMRYLQQRKQELITFSSVVYAEAGGTNEKTKAAVAHSIKNRVELNHWTDPQTITEAISYPGQYDGYNSVRYHNAVAYFSTGRTSANYLETEAMDESMSVVIAIYDNIEPDFTGGVMYFHSFKNASDWIYHDDYPQVIIPGTEVFWWYKG